VARLKCQQFRDRVPRGRWAISRGLVPPTAYVSSCKADRRGSNRIPGSRCARFKYS
jgi:hypothetical protein